MQPLLFYKDVKDFLHYVIVKIILRCSVNHYCLQIEGLIKIHHFRLFAIPTIFFPKFCRLENLFLVRYNKLLMGNRLHIKQSKCSMRIVRNASLFCVEARVSDIGDLVLLPKVEIIQPQPNFLQVSGASSYTFCIAR